MKAMRESKMETSLKATLEEVNQGFESEYNVLLRLSQTMTSNGLRPIEKHYHFSHCCSFDEWNDM